MSSSILTVRNLGVTFGGLKAVLDFNLDLSQGELVGLIGPNGAGKTTVFNLLTGVYTPTEGRIILDGKEIQGMKPYQAVEAGISRTFQNIRLFKQMTVLENVKAAFTKDTNYGILAATFRTPKFWRTEKEQDKRALDLLRIFHLDELANAPSGSLAYGQQRKLEIARALGTGMKVLLLDEPAAGMNPTETAELLDCIKVIRERFGVAILLIEHDMSLVMKICQRIVVIDYGQTIATGTPEEIAANPRVIAAYLGEEEEGGEAPC